jgi:trehalose 6-phosphate phosphatase
MSMARRFGGMGLRVAEVFGGDPANVRAWLTHGTQHLGSQLSSPGTAA